MISREGAPKGAKKNRDPGKPSRRGDLNPGPTVYETVALPTELRRRTRPIIVQGRALYQTLQEPCFTVCAWQQAPPEGLCPTFPGLYIEDEYAKAHIVLISIMFLLAIATHI